VVERLLTAAQLADWMAVDSSYVYEHAAELGAIRLGSGPRARLRFDASEVLRRLSACQTGRESSGAESASRAASRPRRRRRSGSEVALLPIRGVNGGRTAA
jgi:hypothetical protein